MKQTLFLLIRNCLPWLPCVLMQLSGSITEMQKLLLAICSIDKRSVRPLENNLSAIVTQSSFCAVRHSVRQSWHVASQQSTRKSSGLAHLAHDAAVRTSGICPECGKDAAAICCCTIVTPSNKNLPAMRVPTRPTKIKLDWDCGQHCALLLLNY